MPSNNMQFNIVQYIKKHPFLSYFSNANFSLLSDTEYSQEPYLIF